jgi:hypothetical protein
MSQIACSRHGFGDQLRERWRNQQRWGRTFNTFTALAGVFIDDGERQDKLWRLAYFLRFMPIGLIKELLLAVILRRGRLFGFAPDNLSCLLPCR